MTNCIGCYYNNLIGGEVECLKCLGIHNNVFDLIKKKPAGSLTNNKYIKIFNLLKFDDKSTDLIGSFQFSSPFFWRDIDFQSIILGYSTKDELYEKTEKTLKKIFSKILKTKDVFISEFKMGFDHRFLIKLNDPNFMNKIGDLVEDDLIKNSEYILISRLYKSKDLEKKVELKEIIRNLFTIRWNSSELKKGYKILKKNKKITLSEALRQNTLIKLDIYALIAGRYVELTNVFNMILINNNDKSMDFVNITKNRLNQTYQDLMISEINKHSSNLFFQPFKIVKRLWFLSKSLINYPEFQRLLKIMTTIIQSSIGRLNQMEADLTVLNNILKYQKSINWFNFIDEMESFKNRFGNVFDIRYDENLVFNLIDEIIKNLHKKSKNNLIINLTELINYTKKLVDDETISYLKEYKLFPIPNFIYDCPKLPNSSFKTYLLMFIEQITGENFSKYQDLKGGNMLIGCGHCCGKCSNSCEMSNKKCCKKCHM